MTLIPVFKPCTRDELSRGFDMDCGIAEWVSIEFKLEDVKGLDPNLDGLDLDPDETIEYETNNYDVTCFDNNTKKTLSVFIYMNEENDQIIAIDSVVQDHADDTARYDLKDTPIWDVLVAIQEKTA